MTSIIQKKCLKKGGYLRSSGDKVAIAERFTHSTHFAKKKKDNLLPEKKKKTEQEEYNSTDDTCYLKTISTRLNIPL